MKGSGMLGEHGDLGPSGAAGRPSSHGRWLVRVREPDLGWFTSARSGLSDCPMLLFRGGFRLGTGLEPCGVGDIRRSEAGEDTPLATPGCAEYTLDAVAA